MGPVSVCLPVVNKKGFSGLFCSFIHKIILVLLLIWEVLTLSFIHYLANSSIQKLKILYINDQGDFLQKQEKILERSNLTGTNYCKNLEERKNGKFKLKDILENAALKYRLSSWVLVIITQRPEAQDMNKNEPLGRAAFSRVGSMEVPHGILSQTGPHGR